MQGELLKPATLVESLAYLWLAWGICYLAFDVFSETVEAVDTRWLDVVFLNLPLQLVLALTALMADRSPRNSAKRFGATVAVLNTALIIGHVILTMANL